MIKWVKHDVKNRKKIFQNLFSFIKLKETSLEFLKKTVRIEPLVKNSERCYDYLVDEIFSRSSSKAEEKPNAEKPLFQPNSSSSEDDEEESFATGGASGYGSAQSKPLYGAEYQSSIQTTSGLITINQQPSGWEMRRDLLLESLPGYERVWTSVITYSFPAGSLMGFLYEAQEYTEYLPNTFDENICHNLLYQAFNAGLTFKIQEVGDRRGKIVWNDKFPHKTNKTGGPENNGYPDLNHTKKLQKALKAREFEFDASIMNFWEFR
uniref:E3 ubiquitin-protein ligase DTX3L-like n=1 Tax=Styela clava TaxID=7725 RepID=UPI001939D15D|nr:E3 ubiquitin-protein ligase DTX3L-like [Styela clava]